MRSWSASRSRESSPQGDVTGSRGTVPVLVRGIDDKPSATLVVVFGRRFWTGSSTLPHLHHLADKARPRLQDGVVAWGGDVRGLALEDDHPAHRFLADF